MVSKEEPILGIDCGTLNIRTCIFHNETNIEILYNNDGDHIQSYVSFSTEIFIGKRANIGKPTNTVSGYMQILGRKSNEPEIVHLLNNNNIHIVDDDGIPKYKVNFKGETLLLRPELIGAIILNKIQSEAITYLNSDVKDVVITVPLHFNQSQRQATLDSASIAGLNVLRIVNESTAAVVAYYTGIYKSGIKKKILVYHLGASTFDLSVINLSDLGITVEYTTGGYNLGGIFINEIIYDWVIASLRENEYTREISYILRHNINKKIEEAKVQLQKSREAQISVHSCNFDEKLSRTTLQRLIEERVVQKTMAIIDKTLETCNLRQENIDDVLLLGGSSKITTIMEKLKSKFGVCNSANMDHMAARGAAILGAKLQQRLRRNFEVNEYINTYLSVNKEVTDTSLISLNSKQENCIEIWADNENQPKLGVNYYIDNNGILKIHTLEHETGLTIAEIDALKNRMELITEQNESLRSIKQALNELRITVNNYRHEIDELNVFEKYKVIYRNICDDVMNSSNNPTSYDSARKIMRKKKAIENYVNFVKSMVNEEVTYDCIG